MRLSCEVVGTEKDATVILVTAGKLAVAVTTLYFGLGELTAAAFEVFEHELNGGISKVVLLLVRR